MGRGRAKAKQQKVARDLKYNSQPTDLDKLQRELGHGPSGGTFAPTEDDDDEDDGDEWLSASR
jgi:hypothetical protein